MEQIEKILVEIQRLKKELDGYAASEGLDYIESYINLIEREYSIPSNLDEAAKEIAYSVCRQLPNGKERDNIVYYAILSAKAGAEWQAKQFLKGSPMSEDTVLFNKGVEEGKRLAEEEQADLFTIVALDAAQRAKEQMMKEAVECELVCLKDQLLAVLPIKEFQWTVGDKVRVIIVKED